ncbi:MAG: DUF370 domain-containing protein [Firmicutes bacterium HGW-Firmicutes-8]|nr:MAG: DUF370 domain-containing protein [Firmicutes bacterium HGW-Firmicutes-8]
MFIHLGGDVVVSKDEVITILNNQLMKKNEINKEFMELAEEDGFLSLITAKANAKALIITSKRVYMSPISSMTLKKRSDEQLSNLDSFSSEEPW